MRWNVSGSLDIHVFLNSTDPNFENRYRKQILSLNHIAILLAIPILSIGQIYQNILYIFYLDVLKHQLRVMTDNDQNMSIRVREILQRWVMDTATVDNVAQEIVLTAQRHTYGEVIDHIGYFQLEGTVYF